MKKFLIPSLALLLMGTGCNTPLTSDFTPATVPSTAPPGVDEGAFERQVVSAISYDGLSYIQNNTFTAGQFNVPDAIVRENGDIYLYMSGQTVGERFNETAVAISSDQGETWVYKYLNIVNDYPLATPPVDPDVVLLENGTIRMYFTGSAGGNNIGIYYADSQDGLNFTYEGSIYIPSIGDARDSTTFKLGDTWHMYIMKDSDLAQQYYLQSTNGIDFELHSITSFSYEGTPHMPANGILIDDKYHMFMFEPTEGVIRSMWTKDAVSWYPDEGITLEPSEEEGYVKDPAIIELGDTHLMFYVTNLE